MIRITSYVLAAVLMTGGSVSARPPGGGGHGGGGHSGGHSGSYHGGSYRGGSYYGGSYRGGSYNHGYYRPGISIGVFPGSGYRSYYPYGGGYGSYDDQPSYIAPPVVVDQYEPPTVVVPGAEEAAEPAASSETMLRIMVPDPGAQVWVDDLRMSSTGASRVIGFPDEQPGKAYMHKLVVTWMRDGQEAKEEREVRITGGKTTVVDFTRPATKQPEAQPSTIPPVPREENP
jgi:uncharacterized protein (TIGR03000 family)